MKQVRGDLHDRSRELARYMRALRFIDERGHILTSARNDQRLPLDLDTRHVLKASVFLHLYNLVEGTVTACLKRVAQQVEDEGIYFEQLSDQLKELWLREVGKVAEPLNPETRLKTMLQISDWLVSQATARMNPSVQGGNLDDERIEKLLERHGIPLRSTRLLTTSVKKHVVDDMGPLKLIRVRRNELAHGLATFSDRGKDVTVAQLRSWTAVVILYLRNLVGQCELYLSSRGYLASAS